MIRYGMVRPAGPGSATNLEKKTLRSPPGNLTKHWLVGVFSGREKIADLFVVDESTLISGPKSKLWKLAALIWNEGWKVIEQRHVAGGRIWTFTLQRGSEKDSFSIVLTTTFRLQGANIVALEPEAPQTGREWKEHRLSALKLARQLNPSINTEEGELRCRLEQVEGELELLSDEKIALIEAMNRCAAAGSDATLSK
jgi:hypothetical protein